MFTIRPRRTPKQTFILLIAMVALWCVGGCGSLLCFGLMGPR